MMADDSAEVCVVGAGIAGLEAARQLVARGHSVRVLEARDRVGGRTEGGVLCGEPVDVGGQWLGPTQTRALALCEAFGLATTPQFADGWRLMEIDGRLGRYRGTVPKMSLAGLLDADRAMRRLERLAARIDPAAPWTAADAQRLDRVTVADWLARTLWTDGAARLMAILTRAILTCEPHELSMLGFLTYISAAGRLETLAEVHGDGAQKFKVRGGAFQLAIRMAERLPPDTVRLEAAVQSIGQDEAGVTVRHARGVLRAQLLVIAVAPALVGRIHFDAALPAARRQLHGRMPMG